MTDDILKHFEEKFANLPEGTVLVPPTDDDDSDVRSVEFNDPELMSGKGDPKLTPTEVKTLPSSSPNIRIHAHLSLPRT